VGEGGLSPALAQQPRRPLWQGIAAISPAAGLKYRSDIAGIEKHELANEDQRFALAGQLAYAALQSGTPEAYERFRQEAGRVFGPEAAARVPAEYNKPWLMEVYTRGISASDRLKGQRQVGLTPVWGTDAQGKPVLMQLSSTGDVVTPQLPQGVTPSPGGVKALDLKTHMAIQDRNGNIIGYVPKDVAGEKEQEVLGKDFGERPAKMRQAQTNMRQLEVQHDRVTRMLDEVDNLAGFWTTGLMSQPMENIRGTEARRLAGRIRSINANLGLTELRALKDAGVSLGQVTEAEHALMQRLYGELSQAESPEDLKRTVADIRRELATARTLRNEAYARDFLTPRQERQRPAASQGQQGTPDMSRLSPEQQQRYQYLNKKYSQPAQR
jgi:hypothetical protein